MENLLFSLNSTMPLFFIMLLGYGLVKKQFLTEPVIAAANKFVYNITLPVMLFRDLAVTDFRTGFDVRFVVFCAVSTVASILIIWLLCHLFLKDKMMIGEFVQACYRSSAAILGTAFIQNIYGSSGMSGLMILGSVPQYNIFAVLILTIEAPQEKARDITLRHALKNSLKKILRNPTLIAIALGFGTSFLQIPIPVMVSKSMSSIGSMTSPLALLAIGAGFKGKAALGKIKETIIASAIKLLLLPAVFLPIAVHIGILDQQLVALLVMLGSITTPSAYIMAKQLGHEGTLTGSVCAVTTVFSSISLTAWLFWAKSNGYIL